MKSIQNRYLTIENQTREFAQLELNKTDGEQDEKMFFVQFDDYHSVGSDGCIYQIADKDAVEDNDNNPILYYVAESGNVYNYAEDSANFDEEDMAIFNHCKEQAELNMYGDLSNI